jgi:pentatricopeptide repeat protein
MDAMRADGVKPNRQTFNTLITAYGHGQQWERAEAVLRDEVWEGTGLERNHHTYNALIAACERADTAQWERAEVGWAPLFAQGWGWGSLPMALETRLQEFCHTETFTTIHLRRLLPLCASHNTTLRITHTSCDDFAACYIQTGKGHQPEFAVSYGQVLRHAACWGYNMRH